MYNYEEKIGEYRALCQRCGFKHWASEMSQEWNGLYVCKKCWEPRHPLDFQRGKEDDPSVPWTSPDDGETGITVITLADEFYSYTHTAGDNTYRIDVGDMTQARFVNIIGDAPTETDQLIIQRIDSTPAYIFTVTSANMDEGAPAGNLIMDTPGFLAVYRGNSAGKWYLEEYYSTGL